MRKYRLFLALAPILGACSDSGDADGGVDSATTAGADSTTGAMPGQPQPAGSSGGAAPGGGGGGAVVPTAGGIPDLAAPTTDPTDSAVAPTDGTTPDGSSGSGPTGGTTSVGTGGSGPSGGTTSVGTGGSGVSGGPPTGGTSGSGASGGSMMAGGGGGAGGEGPEPSTCPYTPPEDPADFPQGWTSSELTVFNDNGGWTWYNDERVVVDADEGKIIVSSAASPNADIDAVIHDLSTGTNDKTVLGSLSYSDDHNNGGIVIKAPGEYFVAWAHHNVDCNTYWRNYGNGSWGQQVTHAWGQGCPWGTRPDNITYNNPWKMTAEGRYYNFVRSIDTSPNFLFSEDEGQTWEYGGRLTSSPQQGYNAGYYKFWGNGVDRIDFFATEAHPRDADTSVFHGYIQDEKSFDSFGNELDGNLFDGNAPGITEFTTVFSAGATINGATLNALWNFDVARYDDGTIGVLWQGREGARGKDNSNPNHRIAYSRFDGNEWTSTYLVRGGRTLYRDQSDWWEEDYLGGAALDPDNPSVIYVSTPIDPRDDMTTHPNHEIWKGVTCDDGASFQWTPMTMNSPNENLRPVVPKWDARNTAVLWFQGNYQTAQTYTAEVVGMILQE